MPLSSDHFTKPRDPRLEQCLVQDSAHLTKGQHGDAVGKIQSALLELDHAKIAAAELKDKFYGPSTAQAVLNYKTKRNIINRAYQNRADDIVGKMTINRLDEEMQELEKSRPKLSRYINADPSGCKIHNFNPTCRKGGIGQRGRLEAEIEVASDGTMNHWGTPINPVGTGRKVSIGGAWEVEYLGFENFVPHPWQDSSFSPDWILGRKFTYELRPQSCSDISFRSTPISRFMKWEIPRIAKIGARLTYVNDPSHVYPLMQYFAYIGAIIETGSFTHGTFLKDGKPVKDIRRYAIVSVQRINPWLDPNFLSIAGPKPT